MQVGDLLREIERQRGDKTNPPLRGDKPAMYRTWHLPLEGVPERSPVHDRCYSTAVFAMPKEKRTVF